ncbi:MAG: hypothetical protein OXI60_01820 [Acidiferrobacterales bacterium]|nr:hypothetical protein [Acidiferrobacterales bacterium]
MQSQEPRKVGEITLFEFSVVIAANFNNPAILNPDFLRYNKIVDNQYEVNDSPITTPAFSQVKFNNGISVTSTPDQLVFQQIRDELNSNEICSPSIAMRYLKCVPHVSYSAVGINPKGYSVNRSENHVLNMLREGGSWITFKDTSPTVTLKTAYDFGGRKIALEISESHQLTASKNITGTVFQANFHHESKGQNVGSRIKHLNSILESWNRDLIEFFVLVDKYC